MVRRTLLVIILALSAQIAAPARAQTPDPAVQSLIDEGTEAFREARYRDALTRFQEAYERGNVGGLKYHIARCHEELGELAEAAQAYQEFLRSDAPDRAKAQAESALRLIERRLSTGRLVLQVSPFGAAVWVDGEHKGEAPLEPLIVSPGIHEVRVRADGYEDATADADVPAGGEHTVVLALIETPRATADPTTLSEPIESGGPDLTPWAWSTLGLGVALAIGGTTSYLLGEKDHDELVGTPGYGMDGVAERTRRDALDLDSAGDTKKTVGYALWGVAGAAVATSVVLFVLDGDDDVPVDAGATPLPGGAAISFGGRF